MQGYQVGASGCTADFLDVAMQACAAVMAGATHCQAFDDSGVVQWRSVSSDWSTFSTFSPAQFKTCTVSADDADNGVPTVQDGVDLGWAVGGTILLVGVVMFLGRALR